MRKRKVLAWDNKMKQVLTLAKSYSTIFLPGDANPLSCLLVRLSLKKNMLEW